MPLATALALLITGCSTDVYCSKQTGSSTKRKPSPIISSFLELGRRKSSMQPKFVAAQKMLLKQKLQQTFVNGLLGFITLGIYTVSVCIAHNIPRVAELPIDMAIYLHCSLIYSLGSFSCFLHSDQPLSEGEIIPFSGVCQSGEAALSTPEAVVASRTD